MPHTHAAIALNRVTKSFPLGNGRALEVVNIADLALPVGRYTVLRGPSGSGTTTLLTLIAGITTPTAGTVWRPGTAIVALSEPDRDRFRAAHVGDIFQTFNLFAAFTALEHVRFAMMGPSKLPRHRHRQRAEAILVRLGLRRRLSHQPHHRSRGEQQRVAIARALANDPLVVLADDPCASLDPKTARAVLAACLTLCREQRRTLLVVSHDEAALTEDDRLLDMAAINRPTVASVSRRMLRKAYDSCGCGVDISARAGDAQRLDGIGRGIGRRFADGDVSADAGDPGQLHCRHDR